MNRGVGHTAQVAGDFLQGAVAQHIIDTHPQQVGKAKATENPQHARVIVGFFRRDPVEFLAQLVLQLITVWGPARANWLPKTAEKSRVTRQEVSLPSTGSQKDNQRLQGAPAMLHQIEDMAQAKFTTGLDNPVQGVQGHVGIGAMTKCPGENRDHLGPKVRFQSFGESRPGGAGTIRMAEHPVRKAVRKLHRVHGTLGPRVGHGKGRARPVAD